MNTFQAVIFGLDGVLVYPSTTQPFPEALICVQTLRAYDVPLAVIADQTGPLWNEVHEQTSPMKKNKYPTAMEVVKNIMNIQAAFNITDIPWFLTVYDGKAMQILEEYDFPPGENETLVYSEQTMQDISDELAYWLPEGTEVDDSPDWDKSEVLLKVCEQWNLDPQQVLLVDNTKNGREAAAFIDMQYMDNVKDLFHQIQIQFP